MFEEAVLANVNIELKIISPQNEDVEIETNKYGKITSVKSAQPSIVNLLLNKYLVPSLENAGLKSCKHTLNIKEKAILNALVLNHSADTLKSRIVTAIKLTDLMRQKNYAEAKKFFSAREQKNISDIEHNEELFGYWRNGWTLDDFTLDRYISMIKNRSSDGNFIFEEGIWKIDEK